MELPSKISLKLLRKSLDEWLAMEGYYRKRTPKDSTCLFRAVSEQIYSTQCYHLRVRREVVEYMQKRRELFEKFISVPYDFYLQQMACVTEYGGPTEIQAISLLYQSEVTLYDIEKPICLSLTNNLFQNTIYLCRIPPRHYESLYPKSFVSTAGFCQSIVYDLLYKNILEAKNMDDAATEISNDRDIALRHNRFFLKEHLNIREELTAEIYNRMKSEHSTGDDAGTNAEGDSVDYAGGAAGDNAGGNLGDDAGSDAANGARDNTGYNTGGDSWRRYYSKRLTKLLDPNVYRNVDLDIWNEIKREIKDVSRTNYGSFQIGDKCYVRMEPDQLDKKDFDKINNNRLPMEITRRRKILEKQNAQHDLLVFCGYIQEMSKNEGPVLVFIEELGEKRIVPYSALERFTDYRCRSRDTNTRKKKGSTYVDVVTNRCKRDYASNVATDSNGMAVIPVTMTAVVPNTSSVPIFRTAVPTPYSYSEHIERNEPRQSVQQAFGSYAVEDLANNIENCTLSQDTGTSNNNGEVTQRSSGSFYCAPISYFCQFSPYISVSNAIEASSSVNEIHGASLPFIDNAFRSDINNMRSIDLSNSALEDSPTNHPWDKGLDERSVLSCNPQLTAGTSTNFVAVQQQSVATIKNTCIDEGNIQRNKESPSEDIMSLNVQSVNGDSEKTDQNCEKPFDPSRNTFSNRNYAPTEYLRNVDTQEMYTESTAGNSWQPTFVQQTVCSGTPFSGNTYDVENAIPFTGQLTGCCAVAQRDHLPLTYATNYDTSNGGDAVYPLTLHTCSESETYGVVCPILYSPYAFYHQQQTSSWYVGLPLIQGVQHLSCADTSNYYCYCQYGPVAPLFTTNSFCEIQQTENFEHSFH